MSTLPRFLRKNAGPTTQRLNVCPPDVFPARSSLWLRGLRWLARGDADAADALRTPLEKARVEFVAALEGVVEFDRSDLLLRAQHARSLRELWHLRSELYTLVARRASQAEADARLARVNQHFPTRAQRAGSPTETGDVH